MTREELVCNILAEGPQTTSEVLSQFNATTIKQVSHQRMLALLRALVRKGTVEKAHPGGGSARLEAVWGRKVTIINESQIR